MEYLIVIALVVITLGLSARVIRQQTVGIVERLGKYHTTLKPGLSFLVPGIDHIVEHVDLRVREHTSVIDVKTADNMFVQLPVALMLKVVDARAEDAYYKLTDEGMVTTWVLNTLRATTAKMKLSDLYEDRTRLAADVKDELTASMGDYGYEIVNVLVDQPSVSLDVQASFNRVVSSQREKEAAVQEAEAKKIRIVGEATAEAESQKLRAQALADARSILVEGLTTALAKAKDTGIPEAEIMQLLVETNRLDTIKYASEHGRLVLMDVRNPAGLQLPAA